MGSRYGGLKQLDPVGAHGEFIVDYSLYDAKRAGFGRAVLVIKRENRAGLPQPPAFARAVSRIVCRIRSSRICLRATGLPPKRVKPWGTGHAVYAAREQLDAPFCVINADDFYGAEAFKLAARHLQSVKTDDDFSDDRLSSEEHAQRNGARIARGVQRVRRTDILSPSPSARISSPPTDGPLMTEDGQHYTRLNAHAVVSMNMWGFPRAMTDYLR